MMKSKFDSIVKLKKEYLDKAQRRFGETVGALRAVQDKLSKMSEDIMMLDAPMSGDMTEYKAFAAQKHIVRQSMQHVKEELAVQQHRKNEAQQALNTALVEYEKYKYLQTQEQQEHMRLLQKQEAAYMDEVAIMGYNKNKGL